MRTCSLIPKNISEFILWGSDLCHKVSDSPRLDADILLMHLLNKPSSYSRTWPDKVLSEELFFEYEQLIQQRLKPTPVAYIIGVKEFWSREFKVDPSTLIPRPDTELLIETALDLIQQNSSAKSILDLGTGSGCIAITIKKECDNCLVNATELSPQALSIAQYNAQNLAANIRFIQSSWFDEIPTQTFDLIVSNPPYIPLHDEHLTQGDLPAEPISALASGLTGLDDIRLITQHSLTYLKQGGCLMIEHGYDQKDSVFELFNNAHLINIKQLNDLSGQARLTIGEKA